MNAVYEALVSLSPAHDKEMGDGYERYAALLTRSRCMICSTCMCVGYFDGCTKHCAVIGRWVNDA